MGHPTSHTQEMWHTTTKWLDSTAIHWSSSLEVHDEVPMHRGICGQGEIMPNHAMFVTTLKCFLVGRLEPTYIYIHIINVYYTNIYEGMYSCIITGVCYRYAMVGVERYDYFLRGTVPSNVLYSQSISSQKFWTKPRIIQESDLIVLGTSEPNKGSCWPWFLVSGRLQMLDFRSKAHFENFAGRFRKLQSQKIQIHMKETDYWKQ